jgi:Flp pilus assembly protein TadG
MKIMASKVARDERGASAIEFALAAPILVVMIYGIFTLGQLFEADAGMQHGLGEGARYATLCLNPTSAGVCTVPTDTQITNKVTSKLYGPARNLTPDIQTDTTAKTKTITLTYSTTPSFLLFNGPTISMTRSKVVYYAR